ncbi:AMP-binding protein [Actinacidiphila epipremni]|uniref:Long-chain fatty acid--CoA ligase n=1 Tax=Actinacidiphila epipremni TaxID=2053013 RepID=A0ABX0ZN01_9ACTN|nr:AMP-binding protein [Actinacidiphila epipremni]NJP45288.1 long-chain fatty acid--CoA ligase [Actinacidiphila epipremni]
MTSSPDRAAGTVAPPASRAAERPLQLTAQAAGQLTLDAMFARVAARRPDHTAVRVGTGRLTYRGAEQRARQLASLLVLGGMQLGDPVIISSADHRRSLIAQLAVLKAGGVCVPVPAGTPDSALRDIARLSGAQTVLCGHAQRTAFGDVALALPMDDPATWQRAEAVRPDGSLPRSGPIDPAYLLIAPGTGAVPGPVGELVDHRAWQLASAARIQRVGAAEHGVEIRQPAPGGPAALAAMWWAVASAGTLYCGPPDGALTRSPAAVLTPAEYDRLLVPGTAGPRTVVLLGEPCPAELAARHRELLPASRLWAEFAPCAGALPWTARELTREEGSPDRRRRGRSVGQAVAGVRIEVLDERGGSVPPGGAGEVCAVGPALAFDRVFPTASGRPGNPDPGPVLHSALRGRHGPAADVTVLPAV